MEENNILPGLSVLLLSTLCRPQVVTMLFSCLWTGLYYLPIDPSSLMCSLARVSNFLGTLYNDSALPDLWAFSEQSRNFEWLPCIAFQPSKIVPAQLSDFHRVFGNAQNSVTFLPLCSRLHIGSETSRSISIYRKYVLLCYSGPLRLPVLVPLATKGCDSDRLYTYLGSSKQPSCSVLGSV